MFMVAKYVNGELVDIVDSFESIRKAKQKAKMLNDCTMAAYTIYKVIES